MSYDLRCFGWESCVIPHSLKSVQNLIPDWTDLKILRKKRQDENGEELRLISSFFNDPKTGPYMPGYTKGKRIDDGTYGHIHIGTRGIYKPRNDKTNGIIHLERDRAMEDICIKDVRLRITDDERRAGTAIRTAAYEEELRIILAEAFLHALVLKVFENVGLPQRVPKLYEVIGHTEAGREAKQPDDFDSVWIIMEMLSGLTLASYLGMHLISISTTPSASSENEAIITDILIQLAHCLSILQSRLRFNHRDMKLNNIFVRHHDGDEEWARELRIEGYGPYVCKQDITMLDFGFSCIGCPIENTSIVSAGSWFEEGESCFKRGRDLCQFIYALNVSYPLHKYVSAGFYSFLSRVMIADIAGSNANLLFGVDENGVPNRPQDRDTAAFNQGIYIFLKDDRVEVPGCEPLRFLAALRDYQNA